MEPKAKQIKLDVDLLYAGEKLLCENRTFLKKGRFGSFYMRFHGFWKVNVCNLRGTTRDVKWEQAVVRKISKTDCAQDWKKVVEIHRTDMNAFKSINHRNVQKIFGFEKDTDSRYFALEPFDATLEQFVNGQYTGPMPPDSVVLFQIAKGLYHLHRVGLPHGNINPTTILIVQSQPVLMKLADCGLRKTATTSYDNQSSNRKYCNKTSHHRHGQDKTLEVFFELMSTDAIYGEQIGNPKFWSIPSLPKPAQSIRDDWNKPMFRRDVFATGCVFFYFLKRGMHPFGDKYSIVANINQMNPVNLHELAGHFAYKKVEEVLREPTSVYSLICENFLPLRSLGYPLKINGRARYPKGEFGDVSGGEYEGNTAVAIKKVEKYCLRTDAELAKQLEEYKNLDHDNVLRVLHIDFERDDIQRFFVLEMCAGTLADYCRGGEIDELARIMPPDALVLYHIANGLNYIHSKNMVHCDVRPTNILVSVTTPAQIKISDFGFHKEVSSQSFKGYRRASLWMAPEVYIYYDTNGYRCSRLYGTVQGDIFSAGCVFFHFLTRGSHPFGCPNVVLRNIELKNPFMLTGITKTGPRYEILHLHQLPTVKNAQFDPRNFTPSLTSDHFARDLILNMIKHREEERIAFSEVIEQLTPFLPASLT